MEQDHTVSRDWIYFTCGSIASCSSVGRAVFVLPPRPGPDARDIL